MERDCSCALTDLITMEMDAIIAAARIDLRPLDAGKNRKHCVDMIFAKIAF